MAALVDGISGATLAAERPEAGDQPQRGQWTQPNPPCVLRRAERQLFHNFHVLFVLFPTVKKHYNPKPGMRQKDDQLSFYYHSKA